MEKHTVFYIVFCRATGEYLTVGDELNFAPTYSGKEAIRFSDITSANRIAGPISRRWGRTFVAVPQKG